MFVYKWVPCRLIGERVCQWKGHCVTKWAINEWVTVKGIKIWYKSYRIYY